MLLRRSGVFALSVCLWIYGSGANAQFILPPTTTTTTTTTTTSQPIYKDEVRVNKSPMDVRATQNASIDVDTMKANLLEGSIISSALMKTGIFKSVTLLSKTDSEVESRNGGCERSGQRLFFYAEPDSRIRALDPFLMEAGVEMTRPIDSRCSTNKVSFAIRGPAKYYETINEPGRTEFGKNLFIVEFNHDGKTSSLEFQIPNSEAYAPMMRKLQLAGLLNKDAVITNSVILRSVESSVKNTLVFLNEGGKK